jgi:hypothetical protein
MSDERGSNEPVDSAATPVDSDWNANGKHTEAPQAVADDTAEDSAADVTGAAAADDATGTAEVDDGSTFLSALVQAMQTTAAAEQARVADDTDHRREAHLAQVQARREAEAKTLRELADADLKAIDGWAEDERRRIQAERQRRTTTRQALLETTLAEHGATIDSEIAAVEVAISAYRVDTDAFFATLGHETDPVEIARHASQRPAFPALEKIPDTSASASADPVTDAPADGAVAEGAVADETGTADAPVGVMERPTTRDLEASWARWSSGLAAGDEGVSEAPASEAPASDAVEPAVTSATEDDTSSPTPLTASAVVSGQGRVLQTTPVSRPMSWLRRDRDNNEPPTT